MTRSIRCRWCKLRVRFVLVVSAKEVALSLARSSVELFLPRLCPLAWRDGLPDADFGDIAGLRPHERPYMLWRRIPLATSM